MYRGYVAATTEASRNMLNIVFAIIVVLIILWFYQFYYNGKLNANIDPNTGYGNRLPFFIAVALLVLLVLQFFLLWRTGDRLAAYTVVPLLVVISLFTWASWELSTGYQEF
jgi:phosphatidylglycerophosphate synthase